MVSVRNLTKRFGRHVAVDNLTFDVQPGEILGLLGPNGAGKTTTMRMISGYLPPSRGRVEIDGFDLLDRPIEAKRRIGYLPENPPVYPEMTVRTYLDFVAAIKDVPPRSQRAAVDRALAQARLQDVETKRISTLSRGFKQRVGLAQAIVHDAPVLILDEPTSSLDPKQRVEVRELISALRGTHSVLLSTHILAEVSAVADRVFILNAGRVVAVDSPASLSRRLRAREAVTLEIADGQRAGTAEVPSRTVPLSAAVREALEGLPGALHVEAAAGEAGTIWARVESELGHDLRSDVASLVTARGWRLLGLAATALSLEEVFLKMTETEAEDGKSENRGLSNGD